MEKVNYHLLPEVEEFLKEEAEKKGILVSEHIAHILTAYYYGSQQLRVNLIHKGRLNN